MNKNERIFYFYMLSFVIFLAFDIYDLLYFFDFIQLNLLRIQLGRFHGEICMLAFKLEFLFHLSPFRKPFGDAEIDLDGLQNE